MTRRHHRNLLVGVFLVGSAATASCAHQESYELGGRDPQSAPATKERTLGVVDVITTFGGSLEAQEKDGCDPSAKVVKERWLAFIRQARVDTGERVERSQIEALEQASECERSGVLAALAILRDHGEDRDRRRAAELASLALQGDLNDAVRARLHGLWLGGGPFPDPGLVPEENLRRRERMARALLQGLRITLDAGAPATIEEYHAFAYNVPGSRPPLFVDRSIGIPAFKIDRTVPDAEARVADYFRRQHEHSKHAKAMYEVFSARLFLMGRLNALYATTIMTVDDDLVRLVRIAREELTSQQLREFFDVVEAIRAMRSRAASRK